MTFLENCLNMNNPIIGFAGNGHLMAMSAAAAHIKGFKKITYTPAKTGDHPEDLGECDIVYICPDRPSNIEPQAMVDLVLPYLRPSAVLVIHCQVEPGFTRKIKWPSEKLYYHVETLKVNNEALDRALNPERIIIGHAFLCAKNTILLKYLESFKCPIITMPYESAEFAKIAINIYLVAQLDVTNMLAKVADKIGAKWDDIVPALKTDKRIGKCAYLRPGNDIGPHLQRDVDAINKIMASDPHLGKESLESQ
jgi:UDPglucose 6-dehydrogenase